VRIPAAIAAGAFELDADQDAGQQFASARAGVDEDVEVPGVVRSQDPLGAAEVLVELVKSDPAIDQPQDVRVLVPRFEECLGEVDESPHRGA
jgi:hypothetical protein